MKTARKPLTRLQKMLRSDGALCVTFVNTASAKRPALESYADLVAWGVETGALSATDRSRLEAAAAERPGVAAGVSRRMAALHRRLERVFRAQAAGEEVAATDFDPLNAVNSPRNIDQPFPGRTPSHVISTSFSPAFRRNTPN